ncbi:NADH dehydrogenase subunit M [Halomicrobium zhouii]|uniref:NADH dehydrogenase subunit M n=1 Tax=Halomicrobium zhouii TaxID=767519 RepID=A0A1I6KSL7_9EURY|nr:NADH dehydrogenase subunit M [Halomicrobium zhouii]
MVMIAALLGITLLGALVTFLADDRYAGRLATAISSIPALLSVWMYWQYYQHFQEAGNALLTPGEAAFVQQIPWIELAGFELQYYVGLDGVSMPLLTLTTVLTTLALVSSWTPISERQNQFYGLMLLMEASLIGVFAALDFFLWFVFWEGVLIPMYFLIGVWGGPRRKYAAIKFFVYTNVASLVMFVGFFSLVFGLGDEISTLGLPAIAQALRGGAELGSLFGFPLATVAFVLMFFGFAVKVPVFPVHTWLPDAHVEAPTPVSVMLAGVLLKMGTYALLRFNFTMLGDVAQTLAVPIAAIGVLSVIYGAMLALAQRDLKRIVAYSSISSMGYVILGLVAFTPHGVGGATFQMISHGLISGLMFMAVGVIYNETHTRMVGDMSGLADRMPWTVGIFVSAAFGYMGLPLMSGFAAEVLVFMGSFRSTVLPYAPVFTAVAMFGIVVVAGYLLWAMQRSVFGPYRLETDYEVAGAPFHDVAPLVVLLLLVITLGVAPDLSYRMIQHAVNPILDVGGGI